MGARPCCFIAASQFRHLLNRKNTDAHSPYSFIQHSALYLCGEAPGDARSLERHADLGAHGAVLWWEKICMSMTVHVGAPHRLGETPGDNEAET